MCLNICLSSFFFASSLLIGSHTLPQDWTLSRETSPVVPGPGRTSSDTRKNEDVHVAATKKLPPQEELCVKVVRALAMDEPPAG